MRDLIDNGINKDSKSKSNSPEPRKNAKLDDIISRMLNKSPTQDSAENPEKDDDKSSE
jgi:hypothetical protein